MLRELNGVLGMDDLFMLRKMVQLEFLASLEKNRDGTEEASGKEEPHPFDVFLMETTLARLDMGLAVCMPNKSGSLLWYNGLTEMWKMDPPTHKWRIASLSGPARILEALSQNPDEHPLMQAAMERELLVEAETDTSTLDETTIGHLNESQKVAVATITSASFQQGFFCIQGPPGTGKTSTLAAMVTAIGQCTLVLAPSNAAVANVALKLWSSGNFELDDLVVHGANCDASVQFLNPPERGLRYSKLIEKCEGAKGPGKDKYFRDFVSWLRVDDPELSFSELGHICPFLDQTTREGRAQYGSIIHQARVVLSTLNSSGSKIMQDSCNVHTIFLDEACQCPEAEFYIITSFPGVERVVVMGDPKQLASTVIDRNCQALRYGSSWLESVFQRAPDKVHLLDTQYRMDPRILEFPNKRFYESRIICGEEVFSREPSVSVPFMFVDTAGGGHEEMCGFSWQNIFEVTVIKSILMEDQDIKSLLKNTHDKRVLIITPYRAQVQLLRKEIKLPYPGHILEVNTVDSFQGQEGDIVILATVRTHKRGFTDDAQRLNVALTRAKRILRVVGDAHFFKSQRFSILREIVEFAVERNVLVRTKVRTIPWSRPNWTAPTSFKPIMAAPFLHCVRAMKEAERNICQHTLFALAKGDEQALDTPIPKRSCPSWYISCLRGYQERRIVWTAKVIDGKPSIEAHFAGTYGECLRFTQLKADKVPEDACVMKQGLVRVEQHLGHDVHGTNRETNHSDLVVSWPVTNSTQKLLLSGGELPIGSVQLDSFQEEVAGSRPPLIIESRSGTGKTLVLLQHAAYHGDKLDKKPACFVTVSRRLRNELESRYKQINAAENLNLPDTVFFTFLQLLKELVLQRSIRDFEEKGHCTYLGYLQERKSFTKIRVEAHLVENEIGGVICGSLVAAQQRSALTREQYMDDIRSNIGKDTDQDRHQRSLVYDEYEKYVEWKKIEQKYDVGDLVIRLLQEDWPQYFASAYLDEVQDLSYAAIFLVCSLAGKDKLQWVCAGDPAQMISPGCSFTFDGLKQTLLLVRPGIESHLKQVTHLLVNYRTTKEVLNLANEVLAVARKEYPGAIPFARRETAKKDLGFKVVLCDRSIAFQQKVKLGANQAIVLSATNNANAEAAISKWIGSHPFVVTSLESKGLEFDDVIIFFDHDRTVWNLSGKSASSLRMLRELYVAITRAQRRVVILTNGLDSDMMKFFNRLDCEFQVEGAELVLRDFDVVTTTEEWCTKAEEYFFNEVYNMAARCFDIAGKSSWFHWCQGKDAELYGNHSRAAEQFLLALKDFGIEKDYQQVLHVSLALASPSISNAVKWDKANDKLVDEAMKQNPRLLQKFDNCSKVRLALLRESWENISVDDLKDETLSNLFIGYRGHKNMKSLVESGNDEDRLVIGETLPSVIGDFHKERREFARASMLFLKRGHRAISDAIEVTISAMLETDDARRLVELPGVSESWIKSGISPRNEKVELFLELFRSPADVTPEKAKKMLNSLQKKPIVTAVDHVLGDRTQLRVFGCSEFYPEIKQALEDKYENDRIKVALWFIANQENELGCQFLHENRAHLTDEEISLAVRVRYPCQTWVLQETKRRGIFPLVCLRTLSSADLSDGQKESFLVLLADFSSSFECGLVSLLAWCFENVAGKAKSSKSVSSRKATRRGASLADESTSLPTKLVDPISILARKLIAAWPSGISETAGTKFSESELKLLLHFAYNRFPTDERIKFDKVSAKEIGIVKACDTFLELWLGPRTKDRERAICICASVTTSALKSKDTYNQQLHALFKVWIHSTDGFNDVLPGAAVLPTLKLAFHVDEKRLGFQITRTALVMKSMTTKQCADVICFLSSEPSNITSALQHGFHDIALMCTEEVLKEVAIKPLAAGNVLKAWAESGRGDNGVGLMIVGAADLISFLVLLAKKLETREDLMASVVLCHFGSHIYRFAKMQQSDLLCASVDVTLLPSIVTAHKALQEHLITSYLSLRKMHSDEQNDRQKVGNFNSDTKTDQKKKGNSKKPAKKTTAPKTNHHQHNHPKTVLSASARSDDFEQRLKGWANSEDADLSDISITCPRFPHPPSAQPLTKGDSEKLGHQEEDWPPPLDKEEDWPPPTDSLSDCAQRPVQNTGKKTRKGKKKNKPGKKKNRN
ncbi:hypothetical protein ACA910_001246 [Epithemia clementina (nom. ined.)]